MIVLSLSEKITEMQQSLQQLSSQLAEMQLEVEKITEENERLRQQITPVLAKNTNTSDGHKALQQLYEEGYHVCPAYFGREHDGGCIYCMEVLKNVTK